MKLGTRGSDLAVTQAKMVGDRLDDLLVDWEYVTVETKGDRYKNARYDEIGGQGVFVRELDRRVVEGDVDAAVHSMKDMPVERHEDLEIAAVLRRDTPYDVLVTTDGKSIEELGDDPVVGTSSMRRRAQLKRYDSDIEVHDLRGNVDTRVEKLRDGDYDAVVLSGAGVERMDLDVETHNLNLDRFVPSANQGVVAVVAEDGTDEFETLHRIEDSRTRVEATAERIVLSEVGGGCVIPMGVFARIVGEKIEIRGEVLSLDAEEEVKLDRRYPVESYHQGARKMAEEMKEMGAVELIEETERKLEEE
ncbi:MAG: hydroxymethylbilane synthase [Halobacteria archaeon]